jgi:hypothetical protein
MSRSARSRKDSEIVRVQRQIAGLFVAEERGLVRSH